MRFVLCRMTPFSMYRPSRSPVRHPIARAPESSHGSCDRRSHVVAGRLNAHCSLAQVIIVAPPERSLDGWGRREERRPLSLNLYIYTHSHMHACTCTRMYVCMHGSPTSSALQLALNRHRFRAVARQKQEQEAATVIVVAISVAVSCLVARRRPP